jgi:UDP-3-O-[3-hydroxymyristoyl] glucosamine N-acyltransferase
MKSWIKFQLCLGLILSANVSHARMAYPCSGYPGSYHTNPDSSVGGFVASSAFVDSTVSISPEASVCERATVIEGAVITDRSVISGKATVRGQVQISGKAKVYGESYIFNQDGEHLVVMDDAQIYGHAFLQGGQVSGTAVISTWVNYGEVSE